MCLWVRLRRGSRIWLDVEQDVRGQALFRVDEPRLLLLVALAQRGLVGHGRLGQCGRIDVDVFDRNRLRRAVPRSEEHTSELQSLMRISYAVFCLKKKRKQ